MNKSNEYFDSLNEFFDHRLQLNINPKFASCNSCKGKRQFILNNDKLIKKIENLIFKIGGQNNKEARKFNENIANNSLLLLRGREVPCISNNIPTGISEIKFKADCSHIRGLKFNKKNQDLIASSRLI